MHRKPILIATISGPTARASARFAVASPHPDRVVTWRALTLQGNLALERGDDVHARQLYEEALEEAENVFDAAVLLHDAEAARFAPLIYGTSCNNVVELARRQA
jgi:hypothetical protein